MKKLTTVLALSLAFSFAFATGCKKTTPTGSSNAKENQLHNSFISELGGVSETYKGTISKNEYVSQDAAVTGYLTQEVTGGETVNVISSSTTQQYYGPAAVSNFINEFGLQVENPSDIVSVDKMEVTYVQNNSGVSPTAFGQNAGSNKKATVYVIKYSNHWEYYSPAPVTGSTITQSYYDSVFNSDAWINCTYSMNMNMDMDVKASYSGQTMTITMKMAMTQFAQYSADKVYLEQEYSYTMSGMGENETENDYMALYMEEVDNGEGGVDTICYTKTEKTGSWQQSYMYNFNTIDEFRPFATGYLDYTYFTKTDYGFELSGDNAMQYLDETMGNELGAYLSQGMNVNMFVKYYVANGVLSGMREDATLKMNMTEAGVSGSVNGVIGAEASVKNYGSTVVQRPADIVVND